MKLHNTLTRTIKDFAPLHGKTARIYSCGPTVYDHAHIGNLSVYIFADTLRRTLTQHMQVKHVMNYTDVDDKTIRRSQEQYPNDDPKRALRNLTDQYIALFLNDMRQIGNDTDAITFVRATDTIDGMKQLTKKLHAAGYAYVADDGVYFSVTKYKQQHAYGQLVNEHVPVAASRHRISNDEYDKEEASDFALWKKQKPGEPAWEFKIGDTNLTGRPGWHIECSVMSHQQLGQPFDIHTGGVDLIFPHHENEIAQSTATEQNPTMAQVFAHNEHVLVDGKKMAKSAKNFYTLQDVIARGFDPLAFRVLILQAHYRSQVNFSWDNLAHAQNRLNAYREVAVLAWQAVEKPSQGTQSFADTINHIQEHLDNDLNTPLALSTLSTFFDLCRDKLVSTADVAAFRAFLLTVDSLLGLDLSKLSDITDEQKNLIAQRKTARKDKNFTAADSLRDKLARQGIGVRDTAQGPIWYPI